MFRPAEKALLALTARHCIIPITLFTGRHLINKPEQNKLQNTSRGPNYRQENNPYELEIKE